MSDNFVDYEIEEEINNNNKNNNNNNNKNINKYVKELEAEREELYNRIDELLKSNNNNIYNNIKNSGNVTKIISLFWTLVTFYAVYLSFKCNNGFSLLGFLGALILSPFYIAYKLGTHWDICMGSVETLSNN